MKCYLCDNHIAPFLTKNGYTVIRCPSCALAQTVLTEEYHHFVSNLYSEGYFTGDPSLSAYVDYRDDKHIIVKNMIKVFNNIQKYKKEGRVLDVGCALGFFVELCLQRGSDAYGFDASRYASTRAKQLVGDSRIRYGTIDRVRYPKKSFDVISLLDVFEHLADPRKDLQRLSEFLKDDGIFIIATGDTSSFLAKLLKRRWTFYIPPQHLFFFNKENLTTLLGQVGLKPIEWFRVNKWLSIRYVLHLARTTGESVLGERLYGLLGNTRIGKMPINVPVRDNMVVIAMKK